MSKRGQMGGLAGMVTAIISIVITAGIGLYTLSTMNATGNISSAGSEVFASGMSVIGQVINWLPLIVVAVIGGLVLTLFVRQ